MFKGGGVANTVHKNNNDAELFYKEAPIRCSVRFTRTFPW